jgi:hypothetical protein
MENVAVSNTGTVNDRTMDLDFCIGQAATANHGSYCPVDWIDRVSWFFVLQTDVAIYVQGLMRHVIWNYSRQNH